MPRRIKDLSLNAKLPMRLKALPEERTIMGYASAFGNVDAHEEMILAGAYAETIEQDADRIKLLWNHRGWYGEARPIGTPSVLTEDEYGLYYEGRLSETPLGDEILTLVDDGTITENSVGIDIAWDDVAMVTGPDDGVVMAIKKVKRLWEISPVIWGANELAIMQGVKSHGKPWLAVRDELDAQIGRVKSALGSASIVARQLKDQRRQFDRCGVEHGCSNCGGCGKQIEDQAITKAIESARRLEQLLVSSEPTPTQRLLAALSRQ